jgi:signal transduction histidine kinase
MATADIESPPTAESGRAAARRAGRWQLRLAISLPAMLVLFTLAYGLISYRLFAGRWSELEAVGAEEIAAGLLSGHLYSMIALAGLAFVSGLALAITILKPIRAVGETARAIASGRLDQRAPQIPALGELGDLSRSFNSMIEFLNDCIDDRNRYLLDGVVTGLLTADMDGTIAGLNSVGARLLGVEASRVVGRNVDDLIETLPEAHEPFWEHLRDALRADRTPAPDEVLLKTLAKRSSLLVGVSVLRDAGRAPSGVMLNFRDAAEIRDLNRQLTKADQLAALGTFTMGLAHEIRNPLGAIKGLVQLIDPAAGRAAETEEIVGRVVREVNRLDLFIRELLDFANQSPLPPERVEAAALVRAARDQAVGALAGAGIELPSIVEDFGPTPPMTVEPERVVQALANIIRNALEAAGPGRRVTLRARAREEEGERFVEIRVHNTGSTISPEHRATIFDPFFTTKEKGSGLGLAVAFQIVAQNRGSLDVAVGPNEVTFIMRFRAAAGVVEPVEPAEAA